MNRLERIRGIVDDILHRVPDSEDRRCGFVHLYGVSLTATLIARRRGLDDELAAVAGMLHDLVSYETGDPTDHGPRGDRRARDLLSMLGGFTPDEIDAVAAAILHHSDKAGVHTPFDELLKDADVLQHVLYNPGLAPDPRHRARRERLLREFDDAVGAA